MILYFSGASSKKVDDLMKEKKCSRLFSYYSDRKMIEQRICDDIFVDCGAWSAYSKNVTIDLRQYADYLNKYRHCYTVAASLDVIPKGNYVQSARLSADNFKVMRTLVNDASCIIPTYHRGESIDNLFYLLNYEDDFGKLDYIGIGAIASTTDRNIRLKFLDSVFYYIMNIRPDIKVHLFGLTDLSLLSRYKIYSVDSTTWAIAGAMGEIITDFGRIKISNKNYSLDSYSAFSKDEKMMLKRYVENFGFDIYDLVESSESRKMFNIVYMKTFVDKLHICDSSKFGKRKLF